MADGKVWGARCRGQVERRAARADVNVKIGRQELTSRAGGKDGPFLLKMERNAFFYFYTIDQFLGIQFSAQNLKPTLSNKIISFISSQFSLPNTP